MGQIDIKTLREILTRITAVYISHDFIDVGQMEIGFSGGKVDFIQRYPVKRSLRHAPLATINAELGKAMEKCIDMENEKPARIAVNLKNDFFLLRRFSFAKVPEAEIENAVSFEMQKYIPFRAEDISHNFKKVGVIDDRQEVVFGAAEKTNLNNLLQFFVSKGMIPSIAEPEPVLMTRALWKEGSIERDKAYLALHYEPTNKVVITGILDGYPYFFRELNLVPVDEDFETTELSYPPVRNVWGMIEQDVYNATEYLGKEGGKNISKLFISGFAPGHSEEEDISREIGIPIERLKLKEYSSVALQDKDRFVPILTLMHEAVEGPMLNLAPKEIRWRDIWTYKPVLQRSGILLGVILLVHLVLVGVGVFQDRSIAGIRAQFKAYSMIAPDATEAEIEVVRDNTRSKVEFIGGAIKRRKFLSEKMEEICKDVPPNAWLDQINYRNTLTPGDDKDMFRVIGSVYFSDPAETVDVNYIVNSIKKDDTLMRGYEKVDLVEVKKKNVIDKEINEFETILK
ncbi:MAG: hypothetical protein PHH49_06170 [Candidatus Omnitrophica bacterium]|nr:hypothetical protein [Candidatus Omnitrophota bacterium]MDD5488526.1 hypothetical protein [Candidatus Omnitrophota bacterium]